MKLRPATREDARVLFTWRNDPRSYRYFRQKQPVEWDAHCAWLDRFLADAGKTLWMVETDGGPVGYVRLEAQLGGFLAASWAVAPDRHGQGIGGRALLSALAPVTSPVVADIDPANTASRRIAEAAGFLSASASADCDRWLRLPPNGRAFPYPLPLAMSVRQIADRVAGSAAAVVGNESALVGAVAALDDARAGCLTFARGHGPRVLDTILASQATCMLVEADLPAAPAGRAFIKVRDATSAFGRLLGTLLPEHGSNAAGGEQPAVALPADLERGRNCVIGKAVHIGPGCRLGHNVVLGDGTVLGAGVRIQDGAVIGGEGHGYVREDDGALTRWPHLGRVIIADDVEVGMNAVLVRGMLKDTTIGSGSKIGQLVSIGHNCDIGRNCLIATHATLCGSVRLGAGVNIGAAAVLNNHVAVGDNARVGLGAVVTKSVATGTAVFGNPAQPLRTMRPA